MDIRISCSLTHDGNNYERALSTRKVKQHIWVLPIIFWACLPVRKQLHRAPSDSGQSRRHQSTLKVAHARY